MTLQYYAESFQMGIVRRGQREEVLRDRVVWREIREEVNKLFKTNLNEFDRGDGQVYIWQEKNKLQCYGHTHKDAVGRMNMHYILLLGDVLDLARKIEIPTLHQLTDLVGWKYDKPKFCGTGKFGGQPDLFAEITDLHVIVDGAYRHSTKE